MINAVAANNYEAAELTYPAVVMERYLEQALTNRRYPANVPTTAVWAIEQFLSDAISQDSLDVAVDPVISAASYELADNVYRSEEKSRIRKDGYPSLESALSEYLKFLEELHTSGDSELTDDKEAIASSLRGFLQKLRVRGQGESYARQGSCVES